MHENDNDRSIILSASIDDESVEKVISKIIEINLHDDLNEHEWFDLMGGRDIYSQQGVTYYRSPIKLYINSCGGYTYSGLALIDIIKRSKTPVHTIAIGACMSAAFWIWLAGNKRLVGENSTLLFHDISNNVGNCKTEDMIQDVNECKRLREMFINEILKKSTITREALDEVIKNRADWYISSSDAIDLGLSDQYYTGENQ